MKLRWSLLIFLAVVTALVSIPWVLDSIRIEIRTPRRPKRYARVVMEGARMNMPRGQGTGFIRCRRCSLEKQRKGPFTFGGLNVLVLEGLEVVLPPSTNETAMSDQPVEPREIAGRMGLDESFLRLQGVLGKFSALRIEDLTVSFLRGTNVVTAFSAVHGETKSDGLHFQDCDIMRSGTSHVARAVLKVKPSLRLVWPDGEWDLK